MTNLFNYDKKTYNCFWIIFSIKANSESSKSNIIYKLPTHKEEEVLFSTKVKISDMEIKQGVDFLSNDEFLRISSIMIKDINGKTLLQYKSILDKKTKNITFLEVKNNGN